MTVPGTHRVGDYLPNSFSAFLLVLVTALCLAGCGTTVGDRTLSFLSGKCGKVVAEAEANLERGEAYYDAYSQVLPCLESNKPSERRTGQQLFEIEPDLEKRVAEELGVEISGLRSVSAVAALAVKLNTLRRSPFSPDLVSALEGSFKDAIAAGNKAGTIPFLLHHAQSRQDPLNSDEHFVIIVERSIVVLESNPSSARREHVMALVSKLKEHPRKHHVRGRLEKLVPEFEFSAGAKIKMFAEFTPEYILELRQRLLTHLYIETTPTNKLLELDLVQRIEGKYVLLDVHRGAPGRTLNKSDILINIEELAYAEREIPERRVTRTIPRYNVNIFAAVLAMPENSSYMYEHVTRGSKIEYAYSVTATDSKGNQVYEQIVRGTENSARNECQNRRVQNVFGGVQAASFVANDAMAAECAQGDTATTTDLRGRVLRKLNAAISRIPKIRLAISASSVH
jgi:hypothetical protein